jgi:hypothetical protein
LSPTSWEVTPSGSPPTSRLAAREATAARIEVTSEAEWVDLMATAVPTDGNCEFGRICHRYLNGKFH